MSRQRDCKFYTNPDPYSNNGEFVCTRFPPQMCPMVRGNYTETRIEWSFPPCLGKCGEYVPDEESKTELVSQGIDAHKKGWECKKERRIDGEPWGSQGRWNRG